MIDRKGLVRRAVRLDKLAMGLGKELTLWTGYNSLTLTPEVQEYLASLRAAKRSLEQARAAMMKAYLDGKG